MDRKQTGRLLRGIAAVVEKTYNPFTESEPVAIVNPALDKAIEDFAEHFEKKSVQLATSNSPISRILQKSESPVYLMDKVDEALDVEEWTEKDCYRLAALFFLLSAIGE